VDELFTPPGVAWRRVSPRLAVVRRAFLGLWAVVLVVLLLVVGATIDLSRALLLAGLAVLGVAVASGWSVVGRGVRRWGYAELDDELLITSGALFRRLVVVPYGRMQYVDVHSGPVDQLTGIATVRLHTASPGTSAVIPGLRVDEAARLRDRLTARGETQAAGL
jgi:membrane protein YdbS with pleckstrin-like domain